MNDARWQELFDYLNNMSDEELIDKLDKMPESFCIYIEEDKNEI